MASLVRAPIFPAADPPVTTARSGHCLVLHDHHLYVWGGYTEELLEDDKSELYPVDVILPDTDDKFIEVYDVLGNTWDRHVTTNDAPDALYGSTMVGYKHHLYLFGGWDEDEFISEVYQLDVSTFEWKCLEVEVQDGLRVVKPSPRYMTPAVVFESTMCIFGGVGPDPGQMQIQVGAKYSEFQQFGNNYGFGWNNEMFFFDLEKHSWSVPALAGKRPPPCGCFSFNMIDSHRALLFGGRQKKKKEAEVYIFDFRTKKWGEAITQQHPEQPWPAGRSFHSATCLVDPDSLEEQRAKHGPIDQQLLMLWGKGNDNKHCEDVWVFNVRTKQWKEVVTDLRHRMWHMTCADFISTTFTNILLFGGNKHRQSNQEKHVMTDLTVFSFGVLELKLLCLESIRRYGLENLLDRVPYVLKNRFTEYNNAHFYHLLQK